jgi:hypothetical protein
MTAARPFEHLRHPELLAVLDYNRGMLRYWLNRPGGALVQAENLIDAFRERARLAGEELRIRAFGPTMDDITEHPVDQEERRS